MPVTPPAVTLVIAAALAIINLWLGIRVAGVRRREKVLTGDNGRAPLVARMRAQANFAEYVPIALVLMALVELRVGPAAGLWLIGLVLVFGWLLHPFGMERTTMNALRGVGFGATALATVALAIWASILAFTPAGGPTYV